MNNEIYNCEDWDFKCPKEWENLEDTSESKIKFCNQCQENVYFCETEKELEEYSQKLHCVAIENRRETGRRRISLGRRNSYKLLYKSKLVEIILEPTFSLSKDQIFLLKWLFKLKENYIKNNFFDGKVHVLQKDVPLSQAERICRKLRTKNIKYEIKTQEEC